MSDSVELVQDRIVALLNGIFINRQFHDKCQGDQAELRRQIVAIPTSKNEKKRQARLRRALNEHALHPQQLRARQQEMEDVLSAEIVKLEALGMKVEYEFNPLGVKFVFTTIAGEVAMPEVLLKHRSIGEVPPPSTTHEFEMVDGRRVTVRLPSWRRPPVTV